LRTVLRDPTLAVLHWSDASGAYLDGTGTPVPLPAEGAQRGVTYLERQGRPMTALVHDPTILDDPALAQTVLDAVRFVVEKDRLHGHIPATSTVAGALPSGFVTLLMTDIEASTALLRRLGDRYGTVLNDVRGILRAAVSRAGGREIDARADEFFAVFERAVSATRVDRRRRGAHSGRRPQRPPDPDRRRLHRGGRPHHGARLLGSPRGSGRRVRRDARRDRGSGADRHPVPRSRSTSSPRTAGRRDALPGPGAGTAREISGAADRTSSGPPPPAG